MGYRPATCPPYTGYVGHACRGYSRPVDDAGSGWDSSAYAGTVDEWDAAYGCVTDAAVDLDRASDQYFTKASPTFTPTTKMTVRFTFHCTSLSASAGVGVARWGGGQNQFIPFLLSSGILDFYLGSSRCRVTGFTAGATYDVVLVYDGTQATPSDRATMYVGGVDAGATMVGTYPTALPASTANLTIGRNDDGGTFDGWIQCVGISSDALTGAALTAAHTATFFEDMTADRQADWDAGFWNGNQASGALTDSAGVNDLARMNSPGVVAGLAEGTVQSRSPVKTWTGRVNGREFYQTALIGRQPLWLEAAGPGGKPALDFDGVDDFFRTTGLTTSFTFEYSIAFNPRTHTTWDTWLTQGSEIGCIQWAGVGDMRLINGAGASSVRASVTANVWQHIQARSTGATSGTDDKIWVDNVVDYESHAGSTAPTQTLVLGARSISGSRNADMLVGRVIVVDAEISDEDRALLNAYQADYVE